MVNGETVNLKRIKNKEKYQIEFLNIGKNFKFIKTISQTYGVNLVGIGVPRISKFRPFVGLFLSKKW